MRRLVLGVLVLSVVMAGCGGVWVNSEYRELLDKTTAWSSAVAVRGEAGQLSLEEAVQLLRLNATLWRDFQNASVGQAGGTP